MACKPHMHAKPGLSVRDVSMTTEAFDITFAISSLGTQNTGPVTWRVVFSVVTISIEVSHVGLEVS
jgi:hypothetical protein